MINIKRIIAIVLLAATLLACLSSCNITDTPLPSDADSSNAESPGETAKETESETEEDGTLTPPETEKPDEGETGNLGGGTDLPDEPKKEKPENPEKTLLEASKGTYNGTQVLGCNGVTVPAEYNDGVDYDIYGVKDYDNKCYYIFLPCRADLSSVTFIVKHKNGKDSEPYTVDFSDDEISDNEKAIGSQSVYTIYAFKSDLPSIMIQIDESYGTIKDMTGDKSHSTHAYGEMTATVTNEMAAENGWATKYVSVDENPDKYCSADVRGRGNATWGYPKKPFQLKVENDMDLFGMGWADTFILLANYRDAANMRTQLAFEMGKMINIDYTSDYRQVDLFMNGEYLGLYMLAEKVEVGPNRVEIDQQKDILFEADNYATDEGIYGFQTQFTNANKRGFRIHSPEDETLLGKCKSRLILAENALFGSDDAEFEKYFDLDSWARMYLLQLYTMNSDAYYGSFYFYYNAEDGKLHTCSPWDFDWSLGVSWGGDSYKDPMKYDLYTREWMAPMFKHKNFVNAMLDAYYKGGVKEEIAKMPGLVDKFSEENRLSSLMNDMVHDVNYYPDYVTNYDEAVAYLKDICTRRVEFMEKNMKKYVDLYHYDIEG